MIESILAFIGRPFLAMYKSIESFGAFVIFQLQIIPLYATVFSRPKLLFRQIEIIGYGSLGVVSLTALFTGMVEAIQLYEGFKDFGVEGYMGYTIFVSITKELGPVFGTLMVTSRAISAMAAELGTMRVTEQIDAIDLLGVDSRAYLITPRIVATMLSLPLLVLWFDFISISSAYMISTGVLGVNPIIYQDTIAQLGSFSDISNGLIKAFVFGIIISQIGSYVGYSASGGARGVGQATISAVVYSSIALFVSNYFLSSVFLVLGM